MDTTGAPVRTGAVVALKPAELAKSRLGALADPLRRRLAWAMAVDTLSALSAAVHEVLVVGDEPALQARLRRAGVAAVVLAEPERAGMNGALQHGAQALRELGCAVVLACVGDLPALRPGSVKQVLQGAAPYRRSYLSDASGVGTTMLLARETDLDPHFQGRSAAAHAASGAVGLTDDQLGGALPDARRDVDTEADLLAARSLGLGSATGALVDADTGALGRYDSVTVTGWRSATGDQLVLTSSGHRRPLPAPALQDGLRTVRSGQRLHAVVSADAVLAAWL